MQQDAQDCIAAAVERGETASLCDLRLERMRLGEVAWLTSAACDCGVSSATDRGQLHSKR